MTMTSFWVWYCGGVICLWHPHHLHLLGWGTDEVHCGEARSDWLSGEQRRWTVYQPICKHPHQGMARSHWYQPQWDLLLSEARYMSDCLSVYTPFTTVTCQCGICYCSTHPLTWWLMQSLHPYVLYIKINVVSSNNHQRCWRQFRVW